MQKVTLSEAASVVRSKNSGPYELTLDIIFKNKEYYEAACRAKVINKGTIADLYGISEDQVMEIVEFAPANAIKATLVRPIPSGALGETDVYGAQQHGPLLDITLEVP